MKKSKILFVAFLALGGLLCACNNTPPSTSVITTSIAKQGDVCIDLNITEMPKKTNYKVGERFNPSGLKFDAVYQNGYQGDRNLDYGDLDGWTPTGPLTSKDTKVTLIFEGFRKQIDIEVEEKSIQNVEITREPDVKSYQVGDALNLSGLTVKATYEEGVVENEVDYVIHDEAGKIYENGTILDSGNAHLELFVEITSKGITKRDSFFIGVHEGIIIQAENYRDVDISESDGYAEPSGTYKFQSNGTYSGSGYFGDIDIGFELKFHIYAPKAMADMDLILVAASTCVGNGGIKEDVRFNSVFEMTKGEENTPIPVDDTLMIEGGGNSWTNWKDVRVGKVDLKEGYNVFTLKCIAKVMDTTSGNAYSRAPNIDCIKVSNGTDVLTVQAEATGESIASIKESFTKISDKNTVKKDCTFTGDGYLGSINQGFTLDFYIYSEKEVESADLVLIASSTCQGEGRMLDMQFNACFSASKDGDPLEIEDSAIVPGLEYPTELSGGNKWTNWADVNFGKISLKKGFTVVTLTCIGAVKDSSNNNRTPNIDRLDVRFN